MQTKYTAKKLSFTALGMKSHEPNTHETLKNPTKLKLFVIFLWKLINLFFFRQIASLFQSKKFIAKLSLNKFSMSDSLSDKDNFCVFFLIFGSIYCYCCIFMIRHSFYSSWSLIFMMNLLDFNSRWIFLGRTKLNWNWMKGVRGQAIAIFFRCVCRVDSILDWYW